MAVAGLRGGTVPSGRVARLRDETSRDEGSSQKDFQAGQMVLADTRHCDTRPMRSPSAGSVEDSSSARFQPSRRSIPPDGIPPVEGLRMRQVFDHEPVMEAEVVALFAPVPPGVVIDATVGAGGHASALLDAHPHLRLIGIDRDSDAVSAATEKLARFGDRATVRHTSFDHLADEMEQGSGASEDKVTGVLFDLGVSSPQLDRAERGFSYRQDGPLDMRMDPTSGPSAADIVNTWTVDELSRLFAENGEGRFAMRIARAVVAARPFTTTAQFAETVRAAIPAATRRTGGHPARRVFQAVRIAVNDELDLLNETLPTAIEILAPRGRCVAISYHSGEDRIVKAAFARADTGGCVCPPGLPCACGAVPVGRLLFRGARRPTPEERSRNRRAESARLRAIERLDPAPVQAGPGGPVSGGPVSRGPVSRGPVSGGPVGARGGRGRR
jgi:16S rRNA (cytosine1402-N4)-methyltransferase